MEIFIPGEYTKISQILVLMPSTSRIELMVLQLPDTWMILPVQLPPGCIAGSSGVIDRQQNVDGGLNSMWTALHSQILIKGFNKFKNKNPEHLQCLTSARYRRIYYKLSESSCHSNQRTRFDLISQIFNVL